MKYLMLILASCVLLNCTSNKLKIQTNFNKHKQLGDGYSDYQNEIYYKKSKANYSSQLYFPVKTEMHSISFINLKNRYAKDKNNIYYRGEVISNVDHKTFSVIELGSEFPFYEKSIINPKAKYQMKQKIEKDVVTISPSLIDLNIRNEICTLEYYAKDKLNIYYGSDVILNADPNSFVISSILYSKDKSNVYFKGKPLFNSDPRSFEIIVGYLAKDDKHVYYGDDIISDDPGIFEILNFNYVKNDVYVWFIRIPVFPRIEVLYGCSAKDFEIIDNRYAKNDKNVYFHGLLMENANIEQFKVLGKNWSKDDKNIFKVIDICNEIDYDTFKVTEDGAKDKNRFYDKKYKP